MSSTERQPRRRRRSKTPGNTGSQGAAFEQLPWQQLRMPYNPTEPVNDEQLELIHDASLRILEQIGIDVLLPQARDIMV